MFRRLFTSMLMILWLTTAFSFGNDAFFTRTPALSPDGRQVVFSSEGDLWVVDRGGGTAFRLTAMAGDELYPRFSPDGKWLAFSNDLLGHFDVYVMPSGGGTIRQLTFHEGNDLVDSWSWDSLSIYFNSNRYNDFTEFNIALSGGTEKRLFEHFFNTVHGLIEHPVSGDVYFTDSWESFRFAERKRYKGEYNPDIKSYNFKTGEYRVYVPYEGKDLWPTSDRDGHIYFASDRFNGEYNLFRLKDGQAEQLTSFDTAIFYPQVSANGEAVVFERDYQLYAYDVAQKKVDKIAIALFSHSSLALSQDFDVQGNITYFDVSPDGKKFAFVSRGELFVSDIAGKFIRQIVTSPQGRVMEVKWLADNKTVLFNRTTDGWLNLFTIRTDRREAEQPLTSDKANNRNIALNSDRSVAVYLSGSRELKTIDLKTFAGKTAIQDEIWGYYNSQPYFSPDNRYIVFSAYRNFEEDILVYDLESTKTFPITESGVSENEPSWSPDGKYLFFTSDRYKPRYPYGGGDTKIYRLPLEKYDREFKTPEYDKLFSPEKKEEKKGDGKDAKKETPKPAVSIDRQDMDLRWERVSPRTGSQSQSYVVGQKDEYTVLYISNHDGQGEAIWKTTIKPFEENKTEKIDGAETQNLSICPSGDNKYYVLVKGAIQELNLEGHSTKPVKMSYTFRRNLADEFSQMFAEVWANVQENYYDEDFHGVDWSKLKERYVRFIPYARTRADLRKLINDMLGELNSSHLGFTSRGDEEKNFYKSKTMQTGIIFENDRPWQVKAIVPGAAADKKGIDIKPGDILAAVNDRPIDPGLNREAYFTAPSLDSEIKLTFNRGQTPVTALIHPEDMNAFKEHLYDQWIKENQEYIDQKGGGRIAYIYMKDMGQGELNRFIREMTTEAYQREALILDLRYNTGGNVHDAVLSFLSQRPYMQWKYRGGKFSPQPHFAPAAKPIVLLVNEQTLSDGEFTTAGFKALKLGTIIGTETYRWLIFTSGKDLVDGSYYRLPSWGCYTLDGIDLERTGVQPDIEVKTSFKDRQENKDPQLDEAIKVIMSQLKR